MLVAQLWGLFNEVWELALLVLTWFGIALLAIRRQLDWRTKRFTQQVNFSLNMLVEDEGSRVLLLRTLLEDRASNIWLNDYGVGRVLAAARRTTIDQPFLRIHPQRDRDLVMLAALNVLSERYSDVFIGRAVGANVKTAVFLYGLTWERYGEMKTQKMRVMLIKREDLETLFTSDEAAQNTQVVVGSHRRRLHTLACMHQLWISTDPQDAGLIREVELGVVT